MTNHPGSAGKLAAYRGSASFIVAIFMLSSSPVSVAGIEAEYQDQRLACAIVGTDLMGYADSLADGQAHQKARSLLSACLNRSNICGIGLSTLPSGEIGELDVLYEGNRTADLPPTGSVSVLTRSINKDDYKLCAVLSVRLGTASEWNLASWMITPGITEKEKLVSDSCRTSEIVKGDARGLDGDDQPPRRVAAAAWKFLEEAIGAIEFERSMGPCEGVTAEECKEADRAWTEELAERERAFHAGARKECN